MMTSVANGFYFLQNMRIENKTVLFFPCCSDHLSYLDDLVWIKPACWFIKDQHLGVMYQAAAKPTLCL